MLLCQYCQAVLRDGAKFCSECGRKQEASLGIPPTLPLDVVNSTQVVQSDGNTAPGSFLLPPKIKAPLPEVKGWLAEERISVAAKLLAVIPFVDGSHRNENRDLFEKNSRPAAPLLADKSWVSIAFIAGLYGRSLWKRDLSFEQKCGLWDALVWAVLYESVFRPKMKVERFRQLLSFFNGCVEDTAFLGYTLHTIELLLAHLDTARIKELQSAVESLKPAAETTQLLEIIEDRRAASAAISPEPDQSALRPPVPQSKNDTEQIAQAIERLWPLLDRNYESKNQKSFASARQDLNDPKAWHLLAELCGVICRNAVFRYAHNSNLPGGNLSDEQLRDVIVLAEFAERHSSGDYTAKASYYALLLKGLRSMRARTVDPESWVSELRAKFAREEQIKAAGFSWSDVLGMTTHYLSERRKSGHADAVEAEAWIRSFASVAQMFNPADQVEKRLFVGEVRQHGVRDSFALSTLQENLQVEEQPETTDTEDRHPLAFLGSERRKELLECIRDSRLERLNEILHEIRPKLLTELSRVLADPMFDEILPPRRMLRIRGRSADAPNRFQEAKRLIMSPNEADQRDGLALFEQVEAETMARDRDHVPIAREWRLFASARVNGPSQAVPQWEEDRTKGIATWEEIWNLAVFYVRISRIKQALEALKPGLERSKAPFSHLRFALYCSVQILLQERRFTEDILAAAMNFLRNYLEKYPLPVSYLTWARLVNEAQSAHETQDDDNLMKQLKILGNFQLLLDRPLAILKPEDALTDANVEAFEKGLQRLDLEDVWRLWINDYAERNPKRFSAWQALSYACERAGDTARAEDALLHIVSMELDTYQQFRKYSTGTSNLGYLRSHMIRLFDFYQRQARLEGSSVEATFKKYYSAVPELWDGRDNANSKLIKLTRPLLEKMGSGQKRSTGDLPPVQQPGREIWYALASEFSLVQDVGGLRSLQPRLSATIGLLAGEQKLARERADVVIKVLNELCALDSTTWRQEELPREVDRLNGAIQNASMLIEQETVLRPLRTLMEVFRRVFKKFSEEQRLSPKLQVEPTPLGAGIPDDVTQTALILRVTNPGPGTVTNIRATCTDKGVIASNREGVVDSLAQGEISVVAVPVTVSPPEGSQQVECQVNLTCQWGILENVTSSHAVSAMLFSFHDFLQQHALLEFDFPNPYIFEGAIDFTKEQHYRLFQGRENELALIRTVFFEGQMIGAPLYFHGIRRVGKTSLLNRMVLILKEKAEAFAPYVVDLKSIKAEQQPLEVVVNTFTHRILDDVQKQGLNVQGIEPVPVSHENPIIGVEQFFKALRERTGSRQLILLLDEFYLMVAPSTTALLDLLRRIHESGRILFIMSGWLRPEILRGKCPETQLFPLVGRPIDFLPLPAVRKVLHEPIATYGIEIPEATVQHVFLQTAGNPYHVAKIAYNGIVRLNAEHRTVLAPQDIDEIANQLAAEPANFMSSSFSPLILTSEEQSVAIRFAKKLKGKSDFLSIDEARGISSMEVLRSLEEKYILEYIRDSQGERLRIRSKMLTTFLRTRMTEIIPPPPPPSNKKRVGLFVDYENLSLSGAVPPGMKAKNIGDALVHYASRYGDVVCRWVCADPRNIRDWPGVKLGLEQAGFQVQTPSGEPQIGRAKGKENLADFVLLELINDESTHTDPNVYIVAAGDKDYYERIRSLIKGGYTVRLSASMHSGHLADKYRRLEEEREQYRRAEEKPERDFFIDDLEEILQAKHAEQ
jgi:hypothetical protein